MGVKIYLKIKSIERFKIDITFKDDDIFENELIIIHTPGHTKGHISLYYPKDKILIAGDAILVENGELDLANPSFTLDLEAAVRSVEKIKILNPDKIICYHGGMLNKNVIEKLTVLIGKYQTTHYSQFGTRED